MEHRHNPRKQLEFDVILNSHHGVMPGRTVELSDGGAFVELSPPVTSRLTHSVVELVLKYPERVSRERYRLPALVVHSRAEGVGLMFPSGRSEVQQLLNTDAEIAMDQGLRQAQS